MCASSSFRSVDIEFTLALKHNRTPFLFLILLRWKDEKRATFADSEDYNSLSLSIFLADDLFIYFFTFRKPVYSIKPSCWLLGDDAFLLLFFFSSFFSGDILRVYSKSPWQLDGNIASPSPLPPLCYFLLFLEAVLNMYEGWDWQVGFNWFWSALHEQQPALCPFCGGCVLLFFFLFFSSPFSVFSISFISPLICSDNADNTFFLTPQHPRVSASSDFSSVQVQHPQATLESHPNWMSDMC